MSDAPTTRTKRLRVVALDRIENGVAHFNVFSRDLDAEGKQPIAAVQEVPYTDIHETLRETMALLGFASVWSNRYGRLDAPSPAEVLESLKPLYEAIHDGTWTPGRAFEERDPTDIELAVAEATSKPVADIMEMFENTFSKNIDGTFVLDKRGHKSRVYTKRVLDQFAEDPRIKPILARIVSERAKRLSADAKRGGTENSALNSLFAAPTPLADAAN
jgi:hypothetical protein